MPFLGRHRIARMVFVEIAVDLHIQFAQFEFSSSVNSRFLKLQFDL